MSWVRIDDQVGRHQKFLDAGPAASWLWVLGIAHCQSQLTDGFISDKVLPLIGIPKGYTPLALRLVSVGLFDRVTGGYQVHDYLDFNPPRVQVLQKRADDLARKRGGFPSDSTRNPNGFQTESARNPAGIQTESAQIPEDPSRAPAIPSHPSPVQEPEDQDHRLRREALPVENAPRRSKNPPTIASFRVTCAVIGHLFEEPPPTGASSWAEVPLAEIAEHVKAACAKADMGYDNATIHKAIDALTRLRKPVENSGATDFTDLKAVLKTFGR